jgi:hypothetical protein
VVGENVQNAGGGIVSTGNEQLVIRGVGQLLRPGIAGYPLNSLPL